MLWSIRYSLAGKLILDEKSPSQGIFPQNIPLTVVLHGTVPIHILEYLELERFLILITFSLIINWLFNIYDDHYVPTI